MKNGEAGKTARLFRRSSLSALPGNVVAQTSVDYPPSHARQRIQHPLDQAAGRQRAPFRPSELRDPVAARSSNLTRIKAQGLKDAQQRPCRMFYSTNAAEDEGKMPGNLFGFVLLMGRRHQTAIAALSILLFLAGTAPLEVQRRVVNAVTQGAPYPAILLLVLAYLGLVLLEGLTKLALNLYRGWIGEVAIRWLRMSVLAVSERSREAPLDALAEGVQLSIVLAEAEPVGGFVGTSFSEPLLQAGILVAVGGYMIFLQPLMAFAVAVVFFPQLGFVPLMQSAINRRVASKITVMRHVSEGMVEHVVTSETLNAQSDRVQTLFSTNMGIYRIKFTMNFLMNLMTQLGYAGIFALGGYYVVTGKTEIGTVVAFISGLSKITDPWGALVDWYRDLKVTQVKYAMIRDASIDAAALQDADPAQMKEPALVP